MSQHINYMAGQPMSPVLSAFSSPTASWPPPECPGSEQNAGFSTYEKHVMIIWIQ